MHEEGAFLRLIRDRAAMRILFLPHAVRQMSRLDRMITPGDVRAAIASGELIEDYPEDARGHSGLVLGLALDGRRIHVVCSPKVEYLAIITAYLPGEDAWMDNYRRRRTK